jgi:hypothetical protein
MTLPELAIILPSYPEDACCVSRSEKKISVLITFTSVLKAVRIPRRIRPEPEISAERRISKESDRGIVNRRDRVLHGELF